ncbi:MAG: 40S ribosomal protein S19 [Candidatus Micrarchaeota archaeon]
MVSALDVETNKLISKTAEKLKEMKLSKPEFVGIVKTGPAKQRPPADENFWFFRCASLLHQAYVRTSIGTNRLRTHYGGKKKRGRRPERTVRAGGSTIRKAMQELEKAQLLEKTGERKIKNKNGKEVLLYSGRKLTAKGRKLLDSVAKEVRVG